MTLVELASAVRHTKIHLWNVSRELRKLNNIFEQRSFGWNFTGELYDLLIFGMWAWNALGGDNLVTFGILLVTQSDIL